MSKLIASSKHASAGPPRAPVAPTPFANAALDAFNDERLGEARSLFSEHFKQPGSTGEALCYRAAIEQSQGGLGVHPFRCGA